MTTPRRHLIALSAVFWVAMAAPAVLLLLGVSEVSWEKRRLAALPELHISQLGNREFHVEVREWIEDHFPLRVRAAELQSKLILSGWVLEPRGEVVIGEEGWLYFAESLEPGCKRSADRQEALAELTLFANELHQSGKSLLVVITPSKVTVYPEYLPEWSRRTAAGIQSSHETLREMLSKTEAFDFLDLYGDMHRRKADASGFLYPRTDTHWTLAGAEVLPQRIVDHLSPGLYDPSHVFREERSAAPGDLSTLIAARQPIAQDEFATRRPGVVAIPDTRPQDGRFLQRFRHRSEGASLIGPPTLMIFDSFAMTTLRVLPPYFADLTMLHQRLAVQPELLARELSAAEIVILELAERRACGWPRGALSDVRLHGATRSHGKAPASHSRD